MEERRNWAIKFGSDPRAFSGGAKLIVVRGLALTRPERGPEGPWVQNIDRVADIERFAEPAWAKRVRVKTKSGLLVSRSERAKRIAGDAWRSRHLG